MKTTWTRLILGLGTLFVSFAPQCHADPVELTVGGHLLGEYALYPGASISEYFTLNQDTQLGGIFVDIYPFLGSYPIGTYEVTLTAPGGAIFEVSGDPLVQYTPLPGILTAGNYTLTVNGGECANPCYGNVVAGMDFYAPATYTDIGGTITGGNSGGAFYFVLTGDATVPEPGTWALFVTTLFFIPICRYRLRSAADRSA